MKIRLQLVILAVVGLISCELFAQSVVSAADSADEIVSTATPNPQSAVAASTAPPLVIAELISVNYSSLATGTWSSLPDGTKKWIFTYNLVDAEAIGVYFSVLKIPTGGLLKIESDIDAIVLDEETNEDGGGYATRKIYGETLTFTYEIGPEYNGKLYLNINQIAKYVEGDYGFNSSDACMVNVNCSEGNLYRKQQRSVVRIDAPTSDGLISFTGTLINNTSEDCRPYVLTSNYDFLKEGNPDLESFIFYFNYEVLNCGDEEVEPTLQSLTGCQYRASSTDLETGNSVKSDFCLLELNDAIPEEFNVYMSGWSINNNVSNNGVSIHHPAGDVKKISSYDEALQAASYSEYDTETIDEGEHHWKLKFSNTDNGLGMIQPGSIGAPLFDSEGYLIGTLSGSEADCSLTDAYVYFGKMAQHWSSNGSEAHRQLKVWLDPNNLGLDQLEGREANCAFGIGIDEETPSLFHVIPNPASDHIKISVENTSTDNVSIRIFNYLGQTLYTTTVRDQQDTFVDVSQYNNGVYFVHLTIGGKSSIQKLILSH